MRPTRWPDFKAEVSSDEGDESNNEDVLSPDEAGEQWLRGQELKLSVASMCRVLDHDPSTSPRFEFAVPLYCER